MFTRVLAAVALVLLTPAPGAAQGAGTACTPAGVWYGGSVVAYQMTITPAAHAGQYMVMFEGMCTNSVKTTSITGLLTKKGKKLEGNMLALTTSDPIFLTPPPYPQMPDLLVGRVSLEMEGCNTIKNTIPFFGLYFAAGIWEPGVVWKDLKVPLIDPPDVDMLDVLAGGHPIVETYRRLPTSVNPALLH